MTRKIKLKIKNKLIIFCQVGAFYVDALQDLLSEIIEAWHELDGKTEILIEEYQPMLQQVLDLLPRGDTIEQTYGINLSELTPLQIQELFIFQVENEEPVRSQLIWLHEPTREPPEPKPPPPPGQDIGDWNPPIPSCGNPKIDALAMLSSAFGVDGALHIYRHFDREAVDDWITQWNETQKTAEDRREEYLKQLAKDEIEDNTEAYAEAMGLGDIPGFPKATEQEHE